MSEHYYRPIGDDRQGWKITIPVKIKKFKLYKCVVKDDGTLIYVPIPV